VEWRDDGFVIAQRRHGESAAVVTLLTREHGRHAGLVRGGAGPRHRALLQPGNLVGAVWHARLADHLGWYTLEPQAAVAAVLLDDAGRLAALAAACALAESCLPERHPYPALFAGFADLAAALDGDGPWAATYVHWEMRLLDELGFGLDLGACVVSGAREGLRYVSPRSGRAVAEEAAGPWRDRLLPLPAFLVEDAAPEAADVLAGLRLTGMFLARHVLAPHGRSMPPGRDRLVDLLSMASAASAGVSRGHP